ncbi:MAG: GDP-L-fucose synthase [Bacteroidales bacterium]|nr:GDP-L-fucose synthase [Bacteroidales bacterium]
MQKDSKIYIAGHNGLVGSALLRNLQQKGYTNFVLRTFEELDLTNQADVHDFFSVQKPEYIFLAAAKVGGIMANNIYRGQFIIENLQIQNNIIHNSWVHGAKKLLFLGSSCIYPKNAPQPMHEDHLLTGELEYTNEPYAIAKIAGIKVCESYNLQYGTNFVSVMPTNLYGPNDNFHLKNSHVLPGMMRKMYLAQCLETNNMAAIRRDFAKLAVADVPADASEDKILSFLSEIGIAKNTEGKVSLSLWGTGTPLREFLHVSDMADACVHVMENVDFEDLKPANSSEIRNTHINIGSGKEVTIRQLAELIQKVTGYEGEIRFDATKPDGTMRKLLDVSKLEKLGWKCRIQLEDGVRKVFDGYIK